MSADNPLPTDMASAKTWFNRIGLSGKLLAIGGVAGFIAAFLPVVSVSVEMMGIRGSNSAKVVEDWRGKLGLVCYVAAVIFSLILYPPTGKATKNLLYAVLGIGAAAVGLAIWLLILAMDTGAGNVDMMGMGGVKASVGIGAILNVLAGGAVVAGAFLKGQEEKLF